MKPLVITLLLLIICTFCHAQISKGTILLGGRVSLDINSLETAQMTFNSESSRFDISPSVGYMLNNKLMLGITPGYTYTRNVQKSYASNGFLQLTSTTKGYAVYIGPFVRYYFRISENFSFFGHAEATYGLNNSTYEGIGVGGNNTQEYSNYTINLALHPGMVFFVTKRIGIEAYIGVLSYFYSSASSVKSDMESDTQYNDSFSLSFNPSQLGLGINYYFN